ncbi:MAG: Arm DNA-binding domain-containing protein, partial [Azoarcus sp.]|nr:Arm DNA-binding domain-containing protein [Azoarcus sp.]
MRGIEKLSVPKLARLSMPGRYGDGGGLYLQITKRLTKSWIFRYQRHGVEHYMGLGPLGAVGLDEARAAAREARALLARGDDPLRARAAQKQTAGLRDKTFDECAAA